MARLNALLAPWALVIVFDVGLLMILYVAFKDRRISIGHGFFKSYYVERDQNPTGYWLVVALYAAVMISAPALFWFAGPHKG